jgi:hypothetical protein
LTLCDADFACAALERKPTDVWVGR